MFKHISCVFGLVPLYKWLSAFISLACYVCTSIFVGKILTSMYDCCKSIFKLVMNDQSIVMLVQIHAQTCPYISSHNFIFFCLKSSTNVNLKMKRDNELQKPLHILVYDQEKGKATFMNMYDAQKDKGFFIKLKYQKLQASISK